MLTVERANYMWCWDKQHHTTQYSLRADGGLDEHSFVRFNPQVIRLQGEVDEIADWLDQTRNRHSHLNRANGWVLEHLFRLTNKGETVMVLGWSRAGEDRPWPSPWPKDEVWDAVEQSHTDLTFQGPLREIGAVFKEWHAWRFAQKAES